MMLTVFSQKIRDVLESPDRDPEQASMLMDIYLILSSDTEREEFLGALVHRLLIERAKHRAIIRQLHSQFPPIEGFARLAAHLP
jgi:hypothetical protein